MEKYIIIDRRPEKELEISDVTYFFIPFESSDVAEKINKSDMCKRIKEKLEELSEKSEELNKSSDEKINVRFSKNYSETQRKGAPDGIHYVEDKSWQSWNSIDLPVNDDGEAKVSSDYAFVIPWALEKKYVVLYFEKTSFDKLIRKKEDLKSYFTYINAQEKIYRKFYFYFSYRINNEESTENFSVDNVIIQQVSLLSKNSLINKIMRFFHIR